MSRNQHQLLVQAHSDVASVQVHGDNLQRSGEIGGVMEDSVAVFRKTVVALR